METSRLTFRPLRIDYVAERRGKHRVHTPFVIQRFMPEGFDRGYRILSTTTVFSVIVGVRLKVVVMGNLNTNRNTYHS